MTAFSLQGMTALITGGGRGIGRAIALDLAAAGADVVAASRTAEQVEAVAEEVARLGCRTLALPTDVSEPAQVEALVDQVCEAFGHIDVFVNAAAISPYWKRLHQMEDEEWRRIMRVNLDGAFAQSRAAGRVMLERGRGSLIHIASIAGRVGLPHIGAYSVSKAGLMSLTRNLALEWAPKGVRVNAVAPGWVKTEMTAWVREQPEIEQHLRAQIPMGRFAEPEEITGIVRYLASDASSFTTGQVFAVDGGQTMV